VATVTRGNKARRGPLAAVAVVTGALLAPVALVPAGVVLAPRATAASVAAASAAERYPVPPGGVFTFKGRGYGHGHGMSQWGAYGAAKVGGLTAAEILHFYYPHTFIATRSTQRNVRVLLTATDAGGRGYLQVAPADGLALTTHGGKPQTLPTATPAPAKAPISGWRLALHGGTVVLRDHAAGQWHRYTTAGRGAAFTDSAGRLTVTVPGGSASYRGSIVADVASGQLEAVDVVNLELYLRSVVPAEMSASWSSAALQAQAVAARTYATRDMAHPKGRHFDLFGDTRDQAYPGTRSEAARATKAVAATAGEIVVDSANQAVLTQYSSADGGWTVSGGVSYLPSQHDPYDGEVPNSAHAWRTSVSASSIESAYPAVGTLKRILITGRDGHGRWGGRVTAAKLVGSGSTVSVTGTDLQYALGLRSYWFRPIPTPGAPRSLSATASASASGSGSGSGSGSASASASGSGSGSAAVTVTWKAPAPVPGAAAITGYAVEVGKHEVTVAPGARSVTIQHVATGTHAVRVRARSSAGAGPNASTTVTVPG